MPVKGIRYENVKKRPRMIAKRRIWEFDWDVLIILDACRYDAFKMKNIVPGELTYYYSVGSSTGEWTKNTFTEKHPNLTYVSTNPHISDFMTPSITGFIPCKIHCLLTGPQWDDKLECVRPDSTFNYIKGMPAPDGKLILHYIQPHHPFIGKKPIRATGYTAWKTGHAAATDTVWDLFAKEAITRQQAWEAYLSNLELVMEYVKKTVELPQFKDKKVMVTADHGNLFGEYGKCCHPAGYEYEELIKVPLLRVI